MNIDKRWLLLLAIAVSAAAGAAIGSKSRRWHRRAQDVQHKENLKTWENEGGNLAPIAGAPVLP